jgi:pimeloyl-ACP methyl ester carboxylesterase
VQKPEVFTFLQRTFKIEMSQSALGLYHLEPHNDNRIPIILVHGLMSDIHTWLQLINTLQSDPELRKNYRFMGFSYSSGNPIFISAMQLREALEKERKKLKKDGRNLEKFDRMVLIGHSMGGLISRMMISTSNDELLKKIIGLENYANIDHQNPEFRKTMIFEPADYIKRVIFVAVPHRGSELAQSMIGQMASSMIEIPKSLIDFNAGIIRQLVNLPKEKNIDLKRANGIDNLSPDGMALQLMNHLPISEKIPYHSIIGNRKLRGVPGGSDGVVAYSSSHLDGAQSEIVVKSDHSVQQNPLAIQEIKRILKVHLQQFKK